MLTMALPFALTTPPVIETVGVEMSVLKVLR